MAKKDPFADDDVGDERAANQAAAESFKEKVTEKRHEAAGEAELEVDVERAEEELTDLPERQQRSRQEKKQARYREMQEERDAAKREREEMKSQLAQMQMMLQQRNAPPPPPQDPKKSPLQERRLKAFQEQDLLYQSFNARRDQATPDEIAAFKKRAYEIQEEMMEISAEIAMERQGVRPVNEEQVRNQVVREQLMREHGDVLSDPRMADYCEGTWKQLRAKGKPDDWATIAEAAEATRVAFGRAPKARRAPSESYKRKLTSMPRGAGAGGGDDGPRVVTMTAHDKSMANTLYKHIPSEKERYQRWAAGPGRRLAEKKQTG